MAARRICLGCFREWEGDGVCPFCGWEDGKQYGKTLGWALGDVFEQRYLLGFLHCRTSEAAVWSVYDKLLGIPCYLMRLPDAEDPEEKERAKESEKAEQAERAKESEKTEQAGKSELAERTGQSERETLDALGMARGLGKGSVKLLAVKEIGGKKALQFSMEEPVEDMEGVLAALQALLGLSEEQEAVDIEEGSQRAGQKKEQALPNGTLLDGRYQVLECIGIGGFGILYLCHDMASRRLVAMKEYFPAEWACRDGMDVDVRKSQMVEAYRLGAQSFLGEAKFMAKFLHTPHIADIYDVMEGNDTVYLAMEYIPGISIGREMRARGYRPYQPKEAAQILFPVMDALETLHEGKVVHGDVSPGNIMRAEDGGIFLIDLGAAKYALDSRPVFGAAFLKPDYAAPEQYRTAREGIPRGEGPWTDVYALGATMYCLLTGQKPPNVISRLEAEHDEIRLPGKCRLRHAKKWAKLLNHAMALDVKERIGSMGEFRREAAKLLA